MPTINAIGTPQITLGGTFTMSGAYTFIGQLTGNTNVTFPTSGTLATTDGTVQSIQGTANQVLVNGTSGSPVTGTAIILTTPQDIATTSSPTFANLTLTNGNINGVNSQVVLQLTDVASAVNYMRFTNSITAVGPTLETLGSDTDVTMNFVAQGAGQFTYSSFNNTAIVYETGTSHQHVTTFTFADTAESRVVTWPDASGTVAFGGSTIPSITGTANQVLVNGTSGSPVTGTAVTLTTPQDIATSSNVIFLTGLFGSATSFAAGFQIQAVGAIGSSGHIAVASYNNSSNFANFDGYKSASATVGVFSAVSSTEPLMSLNAWGDDGTQFTRAATFQAFVDGTVSNGVVPGKFIWNTANASGVRTIGMTLNSNQQLILANSLLPPSGGLGTGTAPSAGQIPIGNSGGTYTPAAINSGTNITVANGSASITVNLSGIISPVLGGTGVSNLVGSTITVGGPLTLSGAFPAVFNITASTNVTFPVSGTLATTAGASGIVNSGTAGQLAYYAGTGTTVSGTNAGTGVITALGQNVNGSGAVALTTSPTFVTPVLGAAIATSINFGGSTLSNYVSSGTFTPIFTFTTPGDISVVYSIHAGNYTRIGNVVNAQMQIVCTPTWTTASGQVSITGLPIATTSASGFELSSTFISFGFAYPAAATVLFLYAGPSATTMTMYGVTAVGGNPQVGVTQFVSGQSIQIHANFTYLV